MRYDITSRGYLARARERLAENTPQALFYAAFELRCGIEARMEEYLEVWEHVAQKKKTGWQIAVLGRNVEKAFSSHAKVVRWAVQDRATKKATIIFYYTPVTSQLQKAGEKLGNHLHSMKHYRSEDDKYWNDLRTDLLKTASLLEGANTGTLLGPPLMRRGTSKVDMRLEVPPGVDLKEMMKPMLKPTSVNVTYHESLPKEIEAEAIIPVHAIRRPRGERWCCFQPSESCQFHCGLHGVLTDE